MAERKWIILLIDKHNLGAHHRVLGQFDWVPVEMISIFARFDSEQKALERIAEIRSQNQEPFAELFRKYRMIPIQED